MVGMRRREFITLLGGAAATWPLSGRAQEPDRVRRIGALISLAENDPEAQAWISSFTRRLQELGWTAGRNVRIDYRWGVAEQARVVAAEAVAAAPDVILADGTQAMAALRKESGTVPIIFVQIPDPIGLLRACRARPSRCRAAEKRDELAPPHVGHRASSHKP